MSYPSCRAAFSLTRVITWTPTNTQTIPTSHFKTLGALAAGFTGFSLAVPLAGYLGDKGVPRVKACMAISILGGLVSIPAYLALSQASMAVGYLLCFAILSLVGLQAGFMTSIGPLLYPTGVRVSGYGLGHSLATALVGGAAAAVVTVVTGVTRVSDELVTGVVLAGVSVMSVVAGAVLLRVQPQANMPLPKALAALPPILG